MQNNNQGEKRTVRVAKLNQLIVATIIVGILIPIVLCILLFIKVEQLQEQVNELTVRKAQIQEQVVVSRSAEVSASQEAAERVVSEEDAQFGQFTRQSEDSREQLTKVYLTFDDGPSSNTEVILDILKQYNVKATFFVTGKTQEAYIPLYRRIVAEGHTLGMHSYSHRYSEIYASKESFARDLETLQEYLYDITGVWSRFYRFPGGSSNQVSEVPMQELADYLESENMYYLDWNVSCGDAMGENLKPQQIADNVTEHVLKYRTAVVLLHDASDKTSTVEALPIMIETLLEMEHVEFVPVNDEMNIVHHLQTQKD